MSFTIPKEISAIEACRLIAARHEVDYSRSKYRRQLTKDEMMTLARVACKTEDGRFAGVRRADEQ